MYRCGLRTSYAQRPITPLLLSPARRVRIAVHRHPAHRKIARDAVVPTALVLAAIEQDLVEDHVDPAGDEAGDGSLKSRVQPHELGPALNLAVDDLDSTRITDHLGRQCPHQQVDTNEEPRTTKAGLELPGQRRLSSARSAVESQYVPKGHISAHDRNDASSRRRSPGSLIRRRRTQFDAQSGRIRNTRAASSEATTATQRAVARSAHHHPRSCSAKSPRRANTPRAAPMPLNVPSPIKA